MTRWLVAIICGQAVLQVSTVLACRKLKRQLFVARGIIIDQARRVGPTDIETGEPLRTVIARMKQEMQGGTHDDAG